MANQKSNKSMIQSIEPNKNNSVSFIDESDFYEQNEVQLVKHILEENNAKILYENSISTNSNFSCSAS